MNNIEIIRIKLLDYAVAHNPAAQDPLRLFLQEYSNLLKRRRILTDQLDDLAFTYETVKRSAELRLREDDPEVTALASAIDSAMTKLSPMIEELATYCDLFESIRCLLDGRLQIIFVLHYGEGMTLDKIGESDLYPYNRTTVKKDHKKALTILRQYLSSRI